MSKPATGRRPELCGLTPPIARSVDDFPAPWPPSIPSTRPSGTCNVTLSTATTSPYRMDTSSRSTPVTARTLRTRAIQRCNPGKTLMSLRLEIELPLVGDAGVELVQELVLGEAHVDLYAQE